MSLTNRFIEDYRKRRPFYETTDTITARQLEFAPQTAGTRAMVTSRAKDPGRLKSKVLQRNSTRVAPYKDMREIYEDIAGLTGVRVSLYSPGDRDKANSLIADLFTILETKQFPEQSRPPSCNKRFPGYWANHYQAQLKTESLDGTQKRYINTRIEIQVASILMHAWSEVEHNLVYKPLRDILPDKELATVGELNGLVLAGEITLERLQSTGNERMRNKSTTFANQYDLASYLYNYLNDNFRREDVELRMGNVELLFRLISRLEMNTVKEIRPVLRSVKFEKDSRSISQQIISQIVTGSEKRYRIYQKLRIDSNPENRACSQAISNFLSQWVPLERYLSSLAFKNSPKTRGALNISTLKRMNVLDKDCLNEIISPRRT